MERGQRRTPQQPHSGQPQRRPQSSAQRPTQRPPQGYPQRRPVQSSRPAQSARPVQPNRPVPRKRKQTKSKKRWIIGAAIVLLLILIFGSGEDNSSTPPTPTIEPTALPVGQSPEPGTSAMVDHIILTAKADASRSEADMKAGSAFDWIVQNVPQWYEGSEIMEQAIYNGALVEYYYTGKDAVKSEIGMDTVQAVKYVYRGVETVLDDATQENIRQIEEGIEIVKKSDQTNDVLKLQHGEVVSINESPSVTVIKVKVSQSYSNKATVNQNYYNLEGIVKNSRYGLCDELQYWAVTEENGEDVKIFACDLSGSLMDAIRDGSVFGEYIGKYADNLWIHPGLQ